MIQQAGPARHSARSAVGRFFARLRANFPWRHEFDGASCNEIERTARELGLTSRDLEDLVALEEGAADLVYQRMNALGLVRSDVERFGRSLMRDLERTCSLCGAREACRRDLTERRAESGWQEYCPNAITLEALNRVKGRFPA